MECRNYHLAICNKEPQLIANGACLLTMQDSSGKLAKRKYIFE